MYLQQAKFLSTFIFPSKRTDDSSLSMGNCLIYNVRLKLLANCFWGLTDQVFLECNAASFESMSPPLQSKSAKEKSDCPFQVRSLLSRN